MMRYSALLTDLYELTMLAGYLEQGMAGQRAVFDLYFRTNPFEGSYAVFAGLETALDYLEQLRFEPDELDYLHGLAIFNTSMIEFLRGFRFHGKVTAPPEGTVVFANEPLLTVEGSLAEAQFVETALLTIINFQTLVATKAARLNHAAAGATVLEFGLRRAHGPGAGLYCARACCVGGVCSTSNVLAGKLFGLPVRGTHAHSWVQAFPDELTAFRAYAAVFPDSSILLVDTYDTLQSGIPNALIVARELRASGHSLLGVRLDSGDLAFLSREARRIFDDAGFPDIKIVASNELDEFVIESIRSEGGMVDIYGVGTRLSTCAGAGGGALGGVYKLVALEDIPRLKVTSDIAKSTLPARKRVLRMLAPDGSFAQDLICLATEQPASGDMLYDPLNPLRQTVLQPNSLLREVRRVVMKDGKRILPQEPLADMSARCRRELSSLPQGCLRLINPHRYKVSITARLNDLRNSLIDQIRHREEPDRWENNPHC